MIKNCFIIFLLFTVSIRYGYTSEEITAAQPPQQSIGVIEDIGPIKKSDRIFIFAPHPDDETIGCAGVIQKALKAGADIHVAYLTNGDHNEIAFIVFEKRLVFRSREFIHMGEIRRKEAVKAMKMLGLDQDYLIFMGYPDFGTFSMFRNYWNSQKPYMSILTRLSSVPYKENFSYGAVYKPENALEDLEDILRKYKPNKIFVTHPIDTNGDHKALYLFLEVALANLSEELPRPQVYPYLIHWRGWPSPRHYHPELGLTPPKEFQDSHMKWFKDDLSPQELENKHKAVLCYKSQTQSSAFYLLSFCRKNELFGRYPEIDAYDVTPALSPTYVKKELSWNDRILSFFGISNSPVVREAPRDAVSEVVTAFEKQPITYMTDKDAFIIRIKKTEKMDDRFRMAIYLFGYSYRKPFIEMPKISIVTRKDTFKVFDGSKSIPSDSSIFMENEPKMLVLKISRAFLGDPNFILTAIKGYTGELFVDTEGFRKVNIRRQ